MSESEKAPKSDTSPPAPSGSSPPASDAGSGKNTNKNSSPSAPSPDTTSSSTPKSPPPPSYSSNKKKSSSAPPPDKEPTKKSTPPQSPPEKKPPPPPSKSSSTSKPPPPANTGTPEKESPPAPDSNPSKESSPDNSSSPPSPPDDSAKSSPAPPPPSGTSQSQSPSSSTTSASSSPVTVNGPNTPSSDSSPKALAPSGTAPSTSKNPNSGATHGSSPPGGSHNHNHNKQNNVSGTKSLSYEVMIPVLVAAFVVVLCLVVFFIARQKKKKQQSSNANYNMPPPANITVRSDAQVVGHSPAHNPVYYNSQFRGQQTNTTNSPFRGQNYPGSKTFFTYEELMEMTSGFARQNVIGEGGFGCVYKGWMPDGKLVAVKQLKADSGQGEREFRAEVEIISRVHHRHLVSLVGYSMAETQRLLIYEFVPNDTLENHLHAKGLPVLEWANRVKIALGAAKGLAYLHEDCHPKIIHRDIKSANILLDHHFEAKVADFGLARLIDTTQSHVSTRVVGTFGYLAPEYASSGKLTDRSDVYSFGVVLLELITGRKPIDTTQPLGDESLVEWARPLLIKALETGDVGEIIDPRLEKRYVESEVVRMVEAGAACVRHSATKRPRMALVVRALDFQGDPDLSNGVKYGDSTAYDSAKYSQEIMMFRQMALDSTDNSSESDSYSRDYNSREVPSTGRQDSWKSQYSSSGYTSGESETRALKPDTRGFR